MCGRRSGGNGRSRGGIVTDKPGGEHRNSKRTGGDHNGKLLGRDIFVNGRLGS